MKIRLMLLGLFYFLGLPLAVHSQIPLSELVDNHDPRLFQVCPRPGTDDTDSYALCATAACFFLNDLAYCKCDIREGKSISLPFNYSDDSIAERQNVCDLLNAGVDNGFTISTYSTPETLTKKYADDYNHIGPPPMALYTCPAGATGEYAQCDGGICFDSTTGQEFPFIGKISNSEIVCSCPTTAQSSQAKVGFQLAGPWAKSNGRPCKGDDNIKECCDPNWFTQYCFPETSHGNYPTTGTSLYAGAPIGSGLILSRLLDGQTPELNRCFMLEN